MGKRRSSKVRACQEPRQPCGGLQDLVSDRLRTARQQWRQGRNAEALQRLEEVVRREPNNVRPLVDAAGAYAERYEFPRAEALLSKLRQLAPTHPGVHHLAGELYARLKLPVKAMACFEQASSLPGALPRTWVELARLYERAHRLDEASELVQRALRSAPGLPLALLARARIERRGRDPDRAESTLRELIQAAPEGSELAGEAWAELAALMDGRDDAQGAMRAIAHAKRAQLARDTAQWKASEHVLGRFRRMVDEIQPSDFQRWATSQPEGPRQRVALLTGFPRSGTTLLEQVLDAHPDLVSSEERDFLAREHFRYLQSDLSHDASVQEVLEGVSPERLLSERQRYIQVMEWLLGEPIGRRMHLDKNPAYNLVIPVMLRLFPETRLLVALRDPRDVVLSCYLRYLPLNPVSVRFLTLERTVGRYALDMQAWLTFREMLGTEWREVRYEDAVADLQGQTRGMLATLGLPWDDRVMEYRHRLYDKQINSPTYEDVAKPVYSRAIGRWRRYEKYIEPFLETLQPYIDQFGYR